ncbi:MAG TPA: DUF4232 domain-containing protein [Acidobacteriaceae bacterium]|jgi:hypothetical protein|nr:DUF4232 domain-containing protein [Acidobacteriaceae bacterium]
MRAKVVDRKCFIRLFVGLSLLSWALIPSSALASAQASSREKALPCKTSQLSAVNDRKNSDAIDGGVGHQAITIAIKNRSSSSCVLRGVPGVTLSYSPSGRLFLLTVCANCSDYLFSPQAIDAVLLKPQGSAYVVLGFDSNDGAGVCTEADPKFKPRSDYATMTLGLHLPDQEQPLEIVFDEWLSCGAMDVTPFLRQAPIDGALPRQDSPR